MSDKTYTKAELAQLFIESYIQAESISQSFNLQETRSENTKSAFIYALAYLGITEEFAAAVPGFEDITGKSVSA